MVTPEEKILGSVEEGFKRLSEQLKGVKTPAEVEHDIKPAHIDCPSCGTKVPFCKDCGQALDKDELAHEEDEDEEEEEEDEDEEDEE